MNSSKVVFFSLFIFLNFNTSLLAEKNYKNKKTEGNYEIHFPGFVLYREFFENMIHDHPIISSLLVSSVLGYSLYSKECNQFILKNRESFLGLGTLSTFLAMLKRESILGKQDEQNFDFEIMDKYTRFSQSGVRVYYPGDISVTFKDVAGLESAKEDLEDIKMFLEKPEDFEEMGATIPKGVLLNGEPGNGKTLLARALAGEVNCALLYITATEFIETMAGTGAARVRHLFQTAKELAPCIIFIDEIDALGAKRSSLNMGGGDSEYTQTLNQLLAEMDGFEQQENPIIVIAATNRADVLDEALVRPGRFDRKIQINRPFFKDRCEILKIYLDKVKADNFIEIEKIALATIGFSAANLAQLINEAAILAVRQGDSFVRMSHIDQARDYIILGREVKGLDLSQEELWKTAVHEAGHALMYVYQNSVNHLYKVTIIPRSNALGLTYGMPIKEKYTCSEIDMRAEISTILGGSVAEEIIFGHRENGISNDLEKAHNIATEMVMAFGMTEEFKDVSFINFIHNQFHLPDQISTKLHKAVAEIISQQRLVTEKILKEHQQDLLKLAHLLMKKGTVSGSEVYQMCEVQEPELIYSLV